MNTRLAKPILSIAIAAAALTGCASQRWPITGAYGIYEENAFLSSCELRSSSVDYCACALGYLEANVSLSQISSDFASYSRYGSSMPGYMQEAAAQCHW